MIPARAGAPRDSTVAMEIRAFPISAAATTHQQ